MVANLLLQSKCYIKSRKIYFLRGFFLISVSIGAILNAIPVRANSNKSISLTSSFAFVTNPTIIDSSIESKIKKPHSNVEEFNATTMIMEHISDSHEWHLFGDYAIPLPIIIWTKYGFDIFLSNQLENGKTYQGHAFYKLEEDKIKVVDGEGRIMPLENGILKVIDLSITKNVASLFISVLLLLIIFISIAQTYKGDANKPPKGTQSILEPFILFIRDDIAIPNLGKNYTRFMPFLLTLFFFIWVNNLMGLLPFFPGGANLTGNISLTLMLALITFLITNFNGKKSYWGHIFTPSVPWPLYIIMVPVEIIGVFIKPLALTIRLFANITAGHVLVLSLIGLIFIFKNSFVAIAAVPFTVFISLIELLVGFLQAFIFTLLASLYIGSALVESHEH